MCSVMENASESELEGDRAVYLGGCAGANPSAGLLHSSCTCGSYSYALLTGMQCSENHKHPLWYIHNTRRLHTTYTTCHSHSMRLCYNYATEMNYYHEGSSLSWLQHNYLACSF